MMDLVFDIGFGSI